MYCQIRLKRPQLYSHINDGGKPSSDLFQTRLSGVAAPTSTNAPPPNDPPCGPGCTSSRSLCESITACRDHIENRYQNQMVGTSDVLEYGLNKPRMIWQPSVDFKAHAKKLSSLAGSRTPLSRVTGACTNRYTTRDWFGPTLGHLHPREKLALFSPGWQRRR